MSVSNRTRLLGNLAVAFGYRQQLIKLSILSRQSGGLVLFEAASK
jgi:hypothetical protein